MGKIQGRQFRAFGKLLFGRLRNQRIGKFIVVLENNGSAIHIPLMKAPYLYPTLSLAAIALLANICTAQAGIIIGTVVGIADGDTLTVLDHEQREIKVRLAEIDAPEKRQAFGTRSKQSLSDLCFGKQAQVVSKLKDRYKRTVAHVKCSGVDANTEQVKRGMAWVYPRYAKDPSLYVMQEDAKLARRGLWIDYSPIPPWEFRKLKRHASHQ